jgi:hypothetical protein
LSHPQCPVRCTTRRLLGGNRWNRRLVQCAWRVSQPPVLAWCKGLTRRTLDPLSMPAQATPLQRPPMAQPKGCRRYPTQRMRCPVWAPPLPSLTGRHGDPQRFEPFGRRWIPCQHSVGQWSPPKEYRRLLLLLRRFLQRHSSAFMSVTVVPWRMCKDGSLFEMGGSLLLSRRSPGWLQGRGQVPNLFSSKIGRQRPTKIQNLHNPPIPELIVRIRSTFTCRVALLVGRVSSLQVSAEYSQPWVFSSTASSRKGAWSRRQPRLLLFIDRIATHLFVPCSNVFKQL